MVSQDFDSGHSNRKYIQQLLQSKSFHTLMSGGLQAWLFMSNVKQITMVY